MKWTKKEIEFLRENYHLATKKLAKKLNRTIPSVQRKKSRLGLTINRRWEKSEVEFLKKNYGKIPARQIAKKLNKSVLAIYTKAHKLGLKSTLKFRKWSKEKILKELKERAEVLGKSPTAKDVPTLEKLCRIYFGSFNKAKKLAGLDVIPQHNKYVLPNSTKNISPELGYIIGVILGDGWINIKKGGLGLNVKDKDFADFFFENLKKWSKKTPKKSIVRGYVKKFPNGKVSRISKQYKVVLWSVDAVNFITNLLKPIKFNRKTKYTNLKWIYKTPKKFKKMVLRGLFDSEGMVGIYKTSNYLSFKNSDYEIHDLFIKLCSDFGIKAKRWKDDTRISSKQHILRFYKKIGITIKRKRDKLKSWKYFKVC